MPNPYIDFRKKQNICALELRNKEKYYSDLLNIERSWSGRMDASISNTFVMEAEQLLVNAIELFEQGYFDSAYYSLRSAVDLSTTMVFLADMSDDKRENYLEAWKSTSDFPMQGQMIKALAQEGDIFSDMRKNMPAFFEDAKKLSSELNKFVHKQGLQHFYVARNNAQNQNRQQDSFINTFERYLKCCIGVVAVMRLAIDPFPILLMDEEILYRCFDSMTEPYTEEFVDEYIGIPTVEQYRQTEIYKGTYDSIIVEEKKNEAVFNVMKHQYIDANRLEEIFAQLHLLSKDDIISVLLIASNSKVIKTYHHDGIIMYFTNRSTNRKVMSWSGADFKKFRENDRHLNQPYDEAYISVFVFDESVYYIEHNEQITTTEAGEIQRFVVSALDKVGIQTNEHVN